MQVLVRWVSHSIYMHCYYPLRLSAATPYPSATANLKTFHIDKSLVHRYEMKSLL